MARRRHRASASSASSSGRSRGRARARSNLDLLTKTPVPFASRPVDAGSRECLRRLARHRRARDGHGAAVRDPRRDLPERVRAARRSAAAVGLALDVLNGIPAIVIGIFVFGLFVVGHGQSGLPGVVRARRAHAPARRALDDGGARARAELAARGEPRRSASPRWRTTLGDRPAADDRRHPHRRDRSRSRESPARRRRCSSPRRSSARRPTGTRATRFRPIPVAIFELSESPDPRTTRGPGRRRSC